MGSLPYPDPRLGTDSIGMESALAMNLAGSTEAPSTIISFRFRRLGPSPPYAQHMITPESGALRHSPLNT